MMAEITLAPSICGAAGMGLVRFLPMTKYCGTRSVGNTCSVAASCTRLATLILMPRSSSSTPASEGRRLFAALRHFLY